MVVELEELSLFSVAIGIILLFFGSLFDLPELYTFGFLVFSLGIVFVVVQWIVSGGIVELLNWVPTILIFSIIIALSSDFVSQSTSTQNFTWPLMGGILIVILFFIMFQGGDLNIFVPFLPVIVGFGLLGLVIGEIMWNDSFRGLAYSIGALGILLIVIWIKVKDSQRKSPVAGELSLIIGAKGFSETEITPEFGGKVRIGTGIWKAISKTYIEEDEPIRVIGPTDKHLVLEVELLKEK
ncbi:MAG: hypothetical protein ACW99F_12030 [Candidatus Hodarchaeales archaeon]|jgi:hypothetical protein